MRTLAHPTPPNPPSPARACTLWGDGAADKTTPVYLSNEVHTFPVLFIYLKSIRLQNRQCWINVSKDMNIFKFSSIENSDVFFILICSRKYLGTIQLTGRLNWKLLKNVCVVILITPRAKLKCCVLIVDLSASQLSGKHWIPSRDLHQGFSLSGSFMRTLRIRFCSLCTRWTFVCWHLLK